MDQQKDRQDKLELVQRIVASKDLSPARKKAIDSALEHLRLANLRLTVAERLLSELSSTDSASMQEPDDVIVALAALDQAITCILVAAEEAQSVRYLP